MSQLTPASAAAAERLITAAVAVSTDIREGRSSEDLWAIIGEDVEELNSYGPQAAVGTLLSACILLIDNLAGLMDVPRSEVAAGIRLLGFEDPES